MPIAIRCRDSSLAPGGEAIGLAFGLYSEEHEGVDLADFRCLVDGPEGGQSRGGAG